MSRALPRHLIPGFDIMERLGRGGAAGVFRAYREVDGLEVALKVMNIGALDPEFRPEERFRRESEMLWRVSHPVLPVMYGYGVTDHQYAWLALELVHGEPLGSFAEHPAIELIHIFIRLSEALAEVAQEGIVHRDVSPDNILVTERFRRLAPKLIDFGVAKDLFASAAGGGLTQSGSFLGKFAYASPEQIVGLPPGQTLDFRSDVYSLGITMYELLSGRKAVQGEGMAAIVDAHVKGNIPPLVLAPERGGPAPRLSALVSRMTARHREERPASWEEVIAELWMCRAELAPLSETLARKGLPRRAAETPPSPKDHGPQAEARESAPPAPVPAAALSGGAGPGVDLIRREVVLGRAVLAFGVIAFLASLAFAVHVVVRAPRPAPPPTPLPAAAPR